jgi:ABC-type amino acid transport system permease subunit
MAVDENLSLQLDLAATQIVTTILVTLGATLFAISVGIQLTLPPIVNDLVNQVVTERVAVPEIQYDILQRALDNYIVLMTTTGALLVLIGIIYGSMKIGRVRSKIAKATKNVRGVES